MSDKLVAVTHPYIRDIQASNDLLWYKIYFVVRCERSDDKGPIYDKYRFAIKHIDFLQPFESPEQMYDYFATYLTEENLAYSGRVRM